MTGPYDSVPPGPPYGGGGYQPPMGREPDNYLVWSILVTIFCCLPFGIVAIVKSTSVGKLWAQGDAAGAQAAADSAKTWCIVSAVIGVVAVVFSLIVNLSLA